MSKRSTHIRVVLLSMLVVCCVVVYSQVAFADLTEGLVGHWAFDEGASSTAYDSGGSIDGTLTNMDTGNVWVTGKVGDYALDFDGSEDYIDLNSDLEINNVLTVSAWINPHSLSAREIVSSCHDDAPNYNWRFGIDNDGKLFVLVSDDGSGSPGHYRYYTQDVASLQAYEWQHISAVLNASGDTFHIYIDGSEVSGTKTGDAQVGIHRSEEVWVGARGYEGGSRYFDGLIDEVAIWNQELDLEDVGTLYNGGDGIVYALYGGSVPELPPFAMQIMVLLFGGGFGFIKKRFRR